MATTTAASTTSPVATTPVAAVLDRHFGTQALPLPIVTTEAPAWDHVNVQAAIDAFAARPGCEAERLGFLVPAAADAGPFGAQAPTLAEIAADPSARPGALSLVDLADDVGSVRSCIGTGLVLVRTPTGPVALWVRGGGRIFGNQRALDVQAPTVEAALAAIDELQQLMVEHSCFRSKVVHFSADKYQRIQVGFDERPHVTAEQLVLPKVVRERIERHALGIAGSAERLRAASRHLKRGLLLHGAPGTGKTHTIRHLLTRMPEATVFVLVGQNMAWLRFVAERAADLAPAVIVLDDVDLVAEDRDQEGMSPRRHLFDLLDAMDGLGEDRDVLFICTTNRPEVLESAIAARPGRVDLAIEVTPPDAACRAELLSLYGRGLDLRLDSVGTVIDRTAGVTASFLKELVRRSAVLAVAAEGDAEVDTSTIVVRDADVAAALDALLDPANPLTVALLGGAPISQDHP